MAIVTRGAWPPGPSPSISIVAGYSLCGFANPISRASALKAPAAGTMANFIPAGIAGMLL